MKMFEDTQTLDLFSEPVARRTDPVTSHEAAHKASFSASAHRVMAMEALLKHGSLTDFELADVTGLQQTSVGKRRKDCQDAGFIDRLKDQDGLTVKRKTPSGSNAIVWTLTKEGLEWLRSQ
jgi:DNA-binding MarR family transcriptional regulator